MHSSSADDHQVATILHRLTSHSGLAHLEWNHDVPSISAQGAAVLMQALEANVAVRSSCCDGNDWFSATRAQKFRMKPQPKGSTSSSCRTMELKNSVGETTTTNTRSGPSLLFVAGCHIMGQAVLRTYDILGDELSASAGLMVLLFVGIRLLCPSTQSKTA